MEVANIAFRKHGPEKITEIDGGIGLQNDGQIENVPQVWLWNLWTIQTIPVGLWFHIMDYDGLWWIMIIPIFWGVHAPIGNDTTSFYG